MLKGDSIKSLTKVKENNIHCSPFVHQTSHLLVEDNEVSQAGSTLCNSTVTTPYDFFVVHMPGNGFQD